MKTVTQRLSLLAALLGTGVPLGAQTALVQFSVNIPKPVAVAATFGALPKSVTVAEVSVCNDSPAVISRGARF